MLVPHCVHVIGGRNASSAPQTEQKRKGGMARV
jgi:hypothetical protein